MRPEKTLVPRTGEQVHSKRLDIYGDGARGLGGVDKDGYFLVVGGLYNLSYRRNRAYDV